MKVLIKRKVTAIQPFINLEHTQEFLETNGWVRGEEGRVFVSYFPPSELDLPDDYYIDVPKSEGRGFRNYIDHQLINILEDIYDGKLIKLNTTNQSYEAETIPNMVFIKGGTIELIENNHIQTIEFHDFYIGKYPVTQKQWTDVMGTNPSYNKNCDNCPVENVSWNDVQDFIKKLNAKTGKNYRLPTENEWFYAAIGNENYEFERVGHLDISKDLDGSTQPVGQKSPNSCGLYDMCGNVWEWCQDWYDHYNDKPELKVLNGGYNIERNACAKTTEKSNQMGFRLAL
jgi:formylglycine-generating enzyme required for sulfatase activity